MSAAASFAHSWFATLPSYCVGLAFGWFVWGRRARKLRWRLDEALAIARALMNDSSRQQQNQRFVSVELERLLTKFGGERDQ